MGFIQFIYTKTHGYFGEKFSDFGFQMLGMFLTDEVGGDPKTYSELILNPHQKTNTGNIICIEKKGDLVVLSFDSIMNLTDEETLDWVLVHDTLDADETFSLPQKELLHVMQYWVKVRKIMRPKEVWIKCENEVYWVEGVDQLRQQ